MSLYQCDKCGCVENTSLGFFHCRNMDDLYPEEVIGKKLCSECGPTHYKSGQIEADYGKWHGKFPKRIFPLNSLYTDKEGNIRHKHNDEYAV
jgi:predicted nucleic-acid-binding Zn-ribbon protein